MDRRTFSCAMLALMITPLAGCGSSAPDDTGSVSVNTESADGGLEESASLRQSLLEVTTKFMKTTQPDAEPETISSLVASGIAKIRADAPNFLMLSADDEKKLQTGMRVSGAVKRIADAEAFFKETKMQPGGLAAFLLPDYTEGYLSPTEVELLAQLMTADMEKTTRALSN